MTRHLFLNIISFYFLCTSLLDIIAINQRILIPEVSLTINHHDKTSITKENVKNSLTYNITTISDIVEEYYYWDSNMWQLFTNSDNLKLLKTRTTFTSLITNIKTLEYVDEKEIAATVDLSTVIAGFEKSISLSMKTTDEKLIPVDEDNFSNQFNQNINVRDIRKLTDQDGGDDYFYNSIYRKCLEENSIT